MKIFLFSVLITFMAAQTLFSQTTGEFKPEYKISGTIFTGWEFNSGNDNFISKLDSSAQNSFLPFGYAPVRNQFETGQNSFFLERSFLTVLASLAPTVKGRITSDVYSLTDGSGKTQYQLGIKYAWVGWTPVKNDNGFKMDLIAGVIPNQWIIENEKYYGYRGFAKTISDFSWTTSAVKSNASSNGVYNVNRSTGSYFTSSDLGANISLTAPKGFGELYLNVFNGNGFRNLGFDNRFKDIEAVGFIHPFASQINKKTIPGKRISGTTDVTIGGYAYIGKLGLGENYTNGGVQYVRNRAGGMFNIKYNFNNFGFVKFGTEYSLQFNQDPSAIRSDSLVKTNSTGLSTYLEFNPPIEALSDKIMLVARYDIFDPDNSNTSTDITSFNNNTDKQTLLMLGIAYKTSKIFTLGITYQQLGYQLPFVVNYDNVTSDKDSKLIIHAILEF